MKQPKNTKAKPKTARRRGKMSTLRKLALVAVGLMLLGAMFAAFVFFTRAGRDIGSRIPYLDKIYAYFFLKPKMPEADAYGIDVSHHQGTIDWTEVGLIPYDLATRNQGRRESSAQVSIAFVMIKATEGCDYVDDCRATNMDGARKAGLLVGAYHVMTTGDAAEQAKNFFANSGLAAGDMAPVIDLEESILGGKKTAQARKTLKALVAKLEKRYGCKPIIYCGSRFSDDMNLAADYADYPRWIALYGSQQRPADSDVWQFTERGTIPGIGGYVDLNAFYGRRFRLSELRVRR